PAYVIYGAADLGIVGKDILLEQEPDVYEPLDLGFGFCRLVVAEPRELWERDDPAKWSWVRVATKYPRLAEEYFSNRGVQVASVRRMRWRPRSTGRSTRSSPPCGRAGTRPCSSTRRASTPSVRRRRPGSRSRRPSSRRRRPGSRPASRPRSRMPRSGSSAITR